MKPNGRCPGWRAAGVLLAALAGPLQAQGLSAEQLAVQARSQLVARNPQAALATVGQIDQLRGSEPAGFDLLFLQGVTWQELAAQASGGERDRALQQARDAYLQALQRRPDAAAVFNNLAGLAVQAGDLATAGEWYRRAVESGGAPRGYYALNYARALEPADAARALTYARIAHEAAPDSAEARSTLGRLYSRAPTGDAFVRFVAGSVRDGHTAFASELALDHLAAVATEAAPGQRAALLAVVAHALARDPVVLSQPPAPDLLQHLQRLEGDAAAGPGSRQLAGVLVDPPASPAALGWWNHDRVAVLDRTRRAVLRDLLRVLGEQQAAARPAMAERWLRLAVDLGDHGADPEAFLRLVDLLVAQRQERRLPELMQRHEYELFSEKSEAYRRNDWMMVYRLHLALGTTYAYMKAWTSPSPFQNAVFQLENAARAATRFNEAAQRQNRRERLALPAPAALQLAEGYAALGQADRGTRLRIDAADELLKQRRTADGAELLRSVRPEEATRLDAAARQKLTRLEALVRE